MTESGFENFTVLITRISRSIRRLKAEEMAEFGLKGPHVSCLYYLYRAGGSLTAAQLCERCEEDKAAISRSVEFLEREGYIRCRDGEGRRYKSPLMLTERGSAVGCRIAEKIQKIVERAGEGLPASERAAMYQALTGICLRLEAMCAQNKEKER